MVARKNIFGLKSAKRAKSTSAGGAIESLEGRTLFNATYHSLATSNFSQDWSTTGPLLTTADDWSGVASVIGYRGDSLTNDVTTDPQTTVAASTVVNLIPNSASSSSTGGVHEVEASQTIALQGSGTADAPYVQLHLNASTRQNLHISYNLKELDATSVNQKFALQYRLGETGDFTNVPAGAVGNVFNVAGNQTQNVSVDLPSALDNQAQVQIRIITNDASGADAMVGVDDIVVSSVPTGGQFVGFDATTASVNESAGTVALRVTRGVATTGTITVDYATSNGSASAGSDYTTTTGTLTFNPGDTEKFINVPITNDGTVEPVENFTVTLTNPTGATFSNASNVVTVNDDDRPTGGKLLSAGPLSQDWTARNQIINDDDWSGVPYITGYRGDDLTAGTDPQLVLADGSATPIDVNANKDASYLPVNQSGTGGVAEIDGIDIPNAVVTLNGSGTADAPFLLLEVNTTGVSSVDVSYNLRDMDPGADDAIQPIALQYRVGNTGNFTNVPTAFVADATTGPNLATLVTPVAVTLNDPSIANQTLVQFHIMTTNAAGNDEYVGIDDIVIKQTPTGGLPAWVSGAATWDAGTHALTVTGAATIVADPGTTDLPMISADGADKSLTIAPTNGDLRVHVGGLSLTNGATAVLSSVGGSRSFSNHRVLVIKANTLTIGATSKLDLTDNDLILDYTGSPSPAAAVEGLVTAGFGFGDWAGTHGIVSSVAAAPSSNGNYALGVAENSLLTNPFGSEDPNDPNSLNPKFDGETIDLSTVLVKFTNRVDLDLNGLVDGNDAAIFNGGFSEGDGATWMAGDVDLDGLYGSNDAAIFNSFYDESLIRI
jgi:hypothetical protein